MNSKLSTRSEAQGLDFYILGCGDHIFQPLPFTYSYVTLLLLSVVVMELTWLWYSIPILSVLMRIARSIPCWKYLCSTTALMTRRIPLRQEQQQEDTHLQGTLPSWCLWCLLEPPLPSSIMAQSPLQGCSLQQNSWSGLLHHRWGPPWSSARASRPRKYVKCWICPGRS